MASCLWVSVGLGVKNSEVGRLGRELELLITAPQQLPLER